MKQIMSHPWFREHMHKLGDPARFPVPPSPQTTEQPVQDPSEIDDRILETIKFLWENPIPMQLSVPLSARSKSLLLLLQHILLQNAPNI